MPVPGFADQIGVAENGIQLWTEAVFGTRFVQATDPYTIGTQQDTYSCGVCVINAIKAYIHGGAIFTHATRSKHRLEHFIEASNYLLDTEVCPLHIWNAPIDTDHHNPQGTSGPTPLHPPRS